jgi:hypothetical protein
MVIVFDEMAHMIETLEGKASASQVYAAATPSLDQFGKAAMIFCNSSPYSKVGKFYERYVEAMHPFDPDLPVGNFEKDEGDEESGALNGNPLVMAFQFPSWALTDKYREEFRKYPSKYREEYMPPKAYTVSPDWDPDEVDDEGFPRSTEEDKLQISKMRARRRPTLIPSRSSVVVSSPRLRTLTSSQRWWTACTLVRPIGYDEARATNLAADYSPTTAMGSEPSMLM